MATSPAPAPVGDFTAQPAASHSPLPKSVMPAAGLPLEAALGLLLVGGAARRLVRRPHGLAVSAAGC